MPTPPHISERDGATLVAVRLTPRSARREILGLRGDRLAVKVSAPPAEGRANDELRRLIAKTVGVASGRVEIVGGLRSREKLVRIEGLGAAEAARLLDQA